MTIEEIEKILGEDRLQLARRIHYETNALAGDKERLIQAALEIAIAAIESGQFLIPNESVNWDQWVWERRGLLCHWIFCLAHDTYRLKMAEEARDREKERNG